MCYDQLKVSYFLFLLFLCFCLRAAIFSPGLVIGLLAILSRRSCFFWALVFFTLAIFIYVSNPAVISSMVYFFFKLLTSSSSSAASYSLLCFSYSSFISCMILYASSSSAVVTTLWNELCFARELNIFLKLPIEVNPLAAILWCLKSRILGLGCCGKIASGLFGSMNALAGREPSLAKS